MTDRTRGSAGERGLVERFTRAYQADDVAAIVALLTEDISLTMPPHPLEFQGRDLAAAYVATTAFRPDRRSRLIPARPTVSPRSACTSKTSTPLSATRPS